MIGSRLRHQRPNVFLSFIMPAGTPIPKSTFRSLGLHPSLVASLSRLSITKPTPVQATLIPPILSGHSAIGASQTGSGKTLTFLLPLLHHLIDDPFIYHSLILTPTRELAFQISQQINAVSANLSVRSHVLIGGVDEIQQALQLKKRAPHVLIATPGRCRYMLQQGYLSLERVRFMVIDEADRMLDDAYAADLKVILKAACAKERRTLLFSATMTKGLAGLAKRISGEVVTFNNCTNESENELETGEEGKESESGGCAENKGETTYNTVSTLSQQYLYVPSHLKDAHLVTLLKDVYRKESIMIFVRKCATAQFLFTQLQLLGMKKVTTIHSHVPQTLRIESLHKFKSRTVRALIATDLAARGLDIPACEVVVNYDVPGNVETYVHRVGRTARMGRKGVALSLVCPQDVGLVKGIEKRIGKELENYGGVTEEGMMKNLGVVMKARQLANLKLQDSGFLEQYEERRRGRREIAKRRAKKRKAMEGLGRSGRAEQGRGRTKAPKVSALKKKIS